MQGSKESKSTTLSQGRGGFPLNGDTAVCQSKLFARLYCMKPLSVRFDEPLYPLYGLFQLGEVIGFNWIHAGENLLAYDGEHSHTHFAESERTIALAG
jgi:hypothetical protein